MLGVRRRNLGAVLTALLLVCLAPPDRPSRAADPPPSASAILAAVVRLSAEIPPDARSARTLGTSRNGNGVVIDDAGLVLTIGYLVPDAMSVIVVGADGRPVPAEVVAYDYDNGFGLVRTARPLGAKPLPLGDSDRLRHGDTVLVAGAGGTDGAIAATVVSRREFAGYWECLLDEAVFTSPPHPDWGGAALIGADGRLYGIGSLLVGNALGDDRPLPGNMFVPINVLKPIFADLISDGRSPGPARPWLGIFSDGRSERPVVTDVSPGGPAARAGLVPGDVIAEVAGERVATQADFYRRLWRQGPAGTEIRLGILRGGRSLDVVVKSGNRHDYFGFRRSY
jgi:S1-C subfamily serine protease